MTKKNEDEKLNECYQELFKIVIDMQARYNNQMIAGTMMAQALRLYKSNLTDEGFKAMVEVIASSGDTIEPFDVPTIN
jgi:two-component SAPR family response regulator